MTKFRVVQFNMQFGQGWMDEDPDSELIDVEATLAELRAQQADVIFLQEVERAQPAGLQVLPPPNYSRLCAGLSDYDSSFAYPKADARELPFGVGLAIFSKTPLHDRTSTELPSPVIAFEFEGHTTSPTDRLLIGAKTTRAGVEVQLLNTHLLAFFMLGTSSRVYPEQRALVARRLATCQGPTVLGGDFNVRHHTELIQQFRAHGFAPIQEKEVTWRRHPYVLDHIFYNSPLRLLAQSVVPTLASDHHLLVADFELTT